MLRFILILTFLAAVFAIENTEKSQKEDTYFGLSAEELQKVISTIPPEKIPKSLMRKSRDDKY
jgi:hypothetical protein